MDGGLGDSEALATVSGGFDNLLAQVHGCTVCVPHLPLGARPVLRGRPSARLLIVSQAPGVQVHETGVSFNDRSGDRLRDWLGLDRETFYDEGRVAIMPIASSSNGRVARCRNSRMSAPATGHAPKEATSPLRYDEMR